MQSLCQANYAILINNLYCLLVMLLQFLHESVNAFSLSMQKLLAFSCGVQTPDIFKTNQAVTHRFGIVVLNTANLVIKHAQLLVSQACRHFLVYP